MRTVIGVFDNKAEAERTIAELERAGANAENISVLANESLSDLGDIHLQPMDIRGLGRLSASGPMSTYLTQSTANAAPDAITNALVRMGLPPAYARSYVEAVRRGLTLEVVAVEDNKADEALAIMRAHAADLSFGADQRRTEGMRGVDGNANEVIPVVIEELQVGKREVGSGGVRVTSHVEETPVEEEVSLRKERVDVQRRAVDLPVSDADAAFKERTIEVVATSEEPVVAKRARVIEEILVQKDVTKTTKTIRDKVRRTKVDVDRLGEFNRSEYETHFNQNFAKDTDYDFNAYAPAYRFGHEMRGDRRFAGEEWSDVEPNARTAWEERNPGTWDRFKAAVRHAWERATS
jgi:uncharacterized protein (TIGR02271 family)